MTLQNFLMHSYIMSNLKVQVHEDEDELKKHYEQFGEKWKETHDLDDKLKAKLEFKNKSNLALVTVYMVEGRDDHYIAKIYGGLNGSGEWHEYLKDMQHIVDSIKDSYVIRLDVDVPDDVWTLYLGIHKKDL